MAAHDTRGSGYNPVAKIQEPPQQEWQISLPIENHPTECIIDTKQVYYVEHLHNQLPPGTKLKARRLTDGSLEWSKRLPNQELAPPAIGQGPNGQQTIFVPSSYDEKSTGLVQGSVFAIDPASGDELWMKALGTEIGGLTVAGNSVVVTTTAEDSTAVHVLNATTGTERFSKPSNKLQHVPTVYDGAIYFSTSRESLAAVSWVDGTQQWETSTRADDTRPVVDQYRDFVYMGHRRGLEAFDRTTGKQVWNHTVTPADTPNDKWLGVQDEPVVMENQLVVRTQDTSSNNVDDIGHCYGINPQTGKKTWELPEGHPGSSIVGAGDHVLLRRGDSASTMEIGQITKTSEGAAGLVAVDTEGSISWEQRGQWRPIAVSKSGLIGYKMSQDKYYISYFSI
jgi:outer membrane protein assembly factor BamB